jgi:hypothetical protein
VGPRKSEVVGMIRPRERVFSVYRDADVRVIFGAILDDKKGGAFQISADADRVRHKQFYWPSTNVLVTRFLFKEGHRRARGLPACGATSAPPRMTFG